jgi:hypothetical protein
VKLIVSIIRENHDITENNGRSVPARLVAVMLQAMFDVQKQNAQHKPSALLVTKLLNTPLMNAAHKYHARRFQLKFAI